jgi:hypothetical protein
MEHTVSNVDTIKNAKPFAELNEEELSDRQWREEHDR